MRTVNDLKEIGSNQTKPWFCDDLPNGDTLISCDNCKTEQVLSNKYTCESEFCEKCKKEFMYCIAWSW